MTNKAKQKDEKDTQTSTGLRTGVTERKMKTSYKQKGSLRRKGINCTEKKIHFPGNSHFFGTPKKKMKDPEKKI